MDIEIFDTESFLHDWIVVFYSVRQNAYTVYHNDSFGVKQHVSRPSLFVGWNNKHYDNYIVDAIRMGASPETVNEISRWIVDGHQGWEHWLFQEQRRPSSFLYTDIKDDVQAGISLKTAEGHLGMDIEETQVDFDIERTLTKKELEDTIFYCKHDVYATFEIFKLRKEYVKAKKHLGDLAGMTMKQSLKMTNAKLCAAYLKARPERVVNDPRDCGYAKDLECVHLVPQEVLDFFARTKDETLSDEDLWEMKEEINIGQIAPTYAFGGIHYGKHYVLDTRQEKGTIIRNYDVASLYPNIMVKYDLLSAAVPDKDLYVYTLEQRLKAKSKGDTLLANVLKLVLNTTYGCSGNKYNDLFDPYSGKSVCITGQIMLTILLVLYQKVEGVEIIQANTDGVMIALPKEQLPTIHKINDFWQRKMKMTLEEDEIDAIWQKDVNNYIALFHNGKIKRKGGFLRRGISQAGAWAINNNAPIIPEAIEKFLVDHVPLEETVGKCEDMKQFQLIASAGRKYSKAFQEVDGEKVEVQKVNRVYASKDDRYGRLYKRHRETGKDQLIPSLPPHCFIDNQNKKITREVIDTTWYVQEAKKKLRRFLKEEK